MRHYVRKYLLLISAMMCLWQQTDAQELYPHNEGDMVRADVLIELSRGYVSGICVLKNNGENICGAIVNEFGVSALNFTYNPSNNKMKLVYVLDFLDKWYIKRTLKQDLRKWICQLQVGDNEYVNQKRHITYRLSKLKEEYHYEIEQ